MTATNFPPPSGVADEIIAKAIECLNADVWERETKDVIVIRGVLFTHKAVTIPIHKDGSPILKQGEPSVAYGEAFKEAYKRAMVRERDRRMTPLLKRITSETANRRITLARRTLKSIVAAVPVAVGISVIVWATSAISSCSEQAAQAAKLEEARNSEVNQYGYQRGQLAVRYLYPRDCVNGAESNGVPYKFSSNSECKRTWERWERDGEVWVDWKPAP